MLGAPRNRRETDQGNQPRQVFPGGEICEPIEQFDPAMHWRATPGMHRSPRAPESSGWARQFYDRHIGDRHNHRGRDPRYVHRTGQFATCGRRRPWVTTSWATAAMVVLVANAWPLSRA